MKLSNFLSFSHDENFEHLFKITLSGFSEKEMFMAAATAADEDSKSSVINFKQLSSFIKWDFLFSLDCNFFCE